MTRHYLHYVLLYYAHIKQSMRDELNSCIGGTSNSLNPPSQNIRQYFSTMCVDHLDRTMCDCKLSPLS